VPDVSAERRDRVANPPLGVVSVITAVTAIGYAWLLAGQGSIPGIDARVAWVLTVLVGLSVLTAIGTFIRSPVARATIAAASAGALLPLGFLAAFSIGVPLMAAGAIACIVCLSALRQASSRRATVQSTAAGIAAVAVLVIGFVVTG
jgi:hypothetical protein